MHEAESPDSKNDGGQSAARPPQMQPAAADVEPLARRREASSVAPHADRLVDQAGQDQCQEERSDGSRGVQHPHEPYGNTSWLAGDRLDIVSWLET